MSDVVNLFCSPIDTGVSRQAVSDPVFPGGLVGASVLVDVLALAEGDVVFELAVVDVTRRESGKKICVFI